MAKKTYKYEDWFKGMVSSENKSFSEADNLLILQRQQELYNTEIETHLTQLIKHFNKVMKYTLVPEKYLNDEYKEYHFILFGKFDELNKLDGRYHIRMAFEKLVKLSTPPYSSVEYNDITKSMDNNEALVGFLRAEIYFRYYTFLEEQVSKDTVSGYVEILTTRQQVLMLHYLMNQGLFNPFNIHEDRTRHVSIIHSLLNRNKESIRKFLGQVGTSRYKEKFFTAKNLNAIRPFFEEAQMDEVVTEIDNELNKL